MKKIRLLFLTLAALLAGVSAQGKTVYLKPNSNWLTSGARFALYMYGIGDHVWTDFAVVDAENNIYKATFDNNQPNMVFVRMDGNTTENSWDNRWNQSADLTVPSSDSQLYTIAEGLWGKDKDSNVNGEISLNSGLTVTAYTEPSPATGYTVDFNASIATGNHDFKVAKGWGHIVSTNNYDNQGPYYMSYSYYSSLGVGSTGCLWASRQYAGDYSGGGVVNDILVTPAVNGTVTLDVKAYGTASSTNPAFVEVYAINADGTLGSLLKTIKEDIDGYNTGNNTAWETFTLAELTTEQKLGLRLQYVYVDNFTASSVNIPAERKLEVTKVANLEGYDGTGGTTTYFEQQADGTLMVQLQVTLTNAGDYDFAIGDEGYSLTLASASTASGTKTYYDDATVNITEALAVGESKIFDVDFSIPYTTGWKYYFVKENISGTTSSSNRYAGVTAYESKFVLREAGSSSTSDLTTAQDYGRVSSTTTRSFEIYNDGTAPLTIMSITLPTGFTSDNLPEIPAEGLVVAKKSASAAFNVTLPVDVMGDFSGNLVIEYVKAGDTNATNKTLAFKGTVLQEGIWFADFNGNGSTNDGVYPTGSVVTSSTALQFGYTGAYGSYDNYLKSYSSAGMLVMPKLTATAGAQLKYDAVKYQSGNSYTLKVYVSTDRNSLGEAKATINNSDLETSGERYTQTLTFDQAGDYYVAFELQGVGLDNVIGLTKAEVVHDVYFKKTSLVAEAQTGKEIKPSVEAIPLTDETAESYTVKYFVDDEAVATATSIALTASATSSKTFTISYTPTDEETTEHDTYIAFEFTDGTIIATEHQTLKVTNEPKFLFVAASTSVGNYTTNLTTAQSFGKTNTADEKNFKIYNQGTAPLTIKSIVAPEGFSVNKAEQFVVAAGENEDIIVTFSAETAGVYEGNLVVTYEQEGTKTYELAFSGTKLDPNKWYATFGTSSDASNFPAGSLVQANVSLTTPITNNGALSSASSTKNLFITPLLTSEGEALQFDARQRSSWYTGSVKVYAITEHIAAANTTTDAEFTALNPTLLGEYTIETENFTTYSVEVPAGTSYIAFKIADAYVDEMYGLSMADVAHEWQIASKNIPTEAMQNVASTATVNILNLGIKDEATEDITVAVYIDGEAVATAEGIAIPMSHKLTDAGTQQSVTFRSPKAGTFPVYIEVKAGDYSVATEPVYVEFLEEVATAEGIQVGTQTGTGRDYGFVDWYNNDGSTTRYTDILYTATKIEAAGIKAHDKITAISFKASNSAKTFKAAVTSWVGISTGDITYGSPDKAAMAEVSVYNGSVEFPANVESVINLATPIEWDGVSDIRVYTEAVGQGSGNWMAANYAYDSDITMSYNGATKAGPVAYFTLASEPATLSGTVSDGTNAVEGATVTLVSADGDNVQYTGTTNAEGAYSINVIQATREYNVTVTKEGLPDATATVAFGGENQTKDFYMVEPMVVTFVNGANWEKVNAYTYESEQSGTWPGTEISKTGTATIQGVEYDVYTYSLQTPTAPAKIIFNNGNSGDGNQTDNLDFADGEQYVYGITYYSVAGAFRADDASEDVAGIFGTAWATELNDLTKNDEGLYELSFTDVDLAKGTLKFKVVENHAWTTSYPSDNYTVYIAKPGTYSLTITFDANEKSVSHKLYYTLAENNEGIADMADVTVTVERQFKAGWNAVVLPFALTAEEVTEAFGEDSELAVYEGDKNENGAVTVMFKKISDNDKFFSAGYPYMLWLKESVSGLKFTKDISSTLTTAPGTTFDFVGVYEQTDNQDGDYIVQGGEFRKASTANYVLPFRAYLKLKDGQSAARSLNFVIGEGGTTTAINAAEIDGLNIEGVYNLNGQKVTNMNRKGLYIINGKKVMVK